MARTRPPKKISVGMGLRFPADSHELITEAARLRDVSASKFIMQAADRAARRALLPAGERKRRREAQLMKLIERAMRKPPTSVITEELAVAS